MIKERNKFRKKKKLFFIERKLFESAETLRKRLKRTIRIYPKSRKKKPRSG